LDNEALLPFLLAARLTAITPGDRPVFAEGLSSSYEAFLHTRNSLSQKSGYDKFTGHVIEDDLNEPISLGPMGRWYLGRLAEALPLDSPDSSSSHPKVAATVKKVMELWEKGEKVLVFCHYVATGRALRQSLSAAVNRAIVKAGSDKLGCGTGAAIDELEKLGKKFFGEGSSIRKASDSEVESILNQEGFESLNGLKVELIDVIRRFVRTPAFLVRFFPLKDKEYTADSMRKAFGNRDGSGLTLRQILEGFFVFLVERCSESERAQYIEAVKRVQPGSHIGADVVKTYEEEELQGALTEHLAPNVRLVNGSTKQETRQRLMLTFNTPFYPEILVASSVMAEGVDLHLNCRHVIHHDLCWNPSNLEQRTGRVDRIGAKAERCGRSIHVYMPYIAETQDEKMYRVVMDRERWFKVVMGDSFKVDARTTDKLAERIPLPAAIADKLTFRLEV